MKDSTMKKPETNIAFVTRLMNEGILEQAFIISAIDSYARLVKERSETLPHSIIDGRAWQTVADRLLMALDNRV